MFLYKQVPAERLSRLSGNHASRGVWGSALRAKSYKSFQNHSNLFPDKMIIFNHRLSSKFVVLLLASVFCLRQTQVFTSEPLFFSIFICFLYFFFGANGATSYTSLFVRLTNILD